MKLRWTGLVAAALLAVMAGCARHNHQCVNGSCTKAPETCQSCPAPKACAPAPCRACSGRGCGACMPGRADNYGNFNPGPPVGQVTYPYYTTRGPRDFLARNPNSIGP